MTSEDSHGLLLALCRCADPAAYEEEADRWLGQLSLNSGTTSDRVRSAAHYRRVAAACDSFDASHLSLYEFHVPDVDRMSRAVRRNRARIRRPGDEHPALEICLAAAYRPIGHPIRTREGRPPVTGLVAALTDCTDPAREKEFTRWYDEVLVPVTLSSGLFHTGSLYRCARSEVSRRVAPQGPGAYLALYLTDAPDLAGVWHALTSDYRPRWQAEGMYIDALRIHLLSVYQRTQSSLEPEPQGDPRHA